MGGYIAFSFWRRHRDRVAGLVLADTRAGADSDAARAGRYQVINAVAENGTAAVADQLVPKLLSPDAPPELVAEVSAMVLRQPPEGVIAALRAMAARPDATPLLASIDVPCLVAVGERDAITPVAEAKAMVERLPDAELAVIPAAGHLAPLEEPGAFNAALRHFLEANRKPAWP
jgi:pimeloyl-ACP methyl ester carboxylesterase